MRTGFPRMVLLMKVVVAFGTRPELIKLAPVILELRRFPRRFTTVLLATAQHREMLDQMLGVFGLEPDIDLGLMTANQTLAELTGRAMAGVSAVLDKVHPNLLIVQGDTTTAMTASLAAFYQGVPVAHVEAGLRTGDPRNPFPEEINRRIISVLADLHFAPTVTSARHLRREGVPSDRIHVTGNTVVDALQRMTPRLKRVPPPVTPPPGRRLVLVTAHRRESFGVPLENICRALLDLTEKFGDIEIVYPVHPNPRVVEVTNRLLRGRPRFHLLPPLDYLSFLRLVREAYLVVTDSGGLQEEAPAFGKPVLVLRRVTERPEGVRAGAARLVAPERSAIVREASRLLDGDREYRKMALARNPYGDGRAARRIVKAVREWSRTATR